MLPKNEWAQLIPHAGGMCLLDAVIAWDRDTIHAISDGHRDASHPLRHDGRLHAVHLAEYGAQAGAVHGALCARAQDNAAPGPGVLVALRDVRLGCEWIEALPGSLHVHARCLLADTAGAHYDFRVLHAGHCLASGRCAVIHGDTAGDDA